MADVATQAGAGQTAAGMLVKALDQEERARLLIAENPTMAARILGIAIDSVILVDGGARSAARQEMHRLSRLVRAAHPHLTCD
jgi:hypothetical protein